MVMLRVLSMAEVEVFNNLGQISTVFIGALVLKNENVTWSQVVKVIIMFIGVMLIILGKRKTVELTNSSKDA